MLCKLERKKPNNTKDLGNELHLSHEPCQAQQNTTTHLRATRSEREAGERKREKSKWSLRLKTRSLLNGQLSSIVLVFVVMLPLFKCSVASSVTATVMRHAS